MDRSVNNAKSVRILSSLALAGYRSFGSELQRFQSFAQINIFIGQNNCGKSNVLRFIHDWLAQTDARLRIALDDHHRHFPYGAQLRHGFRLKCANDGCVNIGELKEKYFPNTDLSTHAAIKEIFEAKMLLDCDPEGPWFEFNEGNVFQIEQWEKAVTKVDDWNLRSLWTIFTKHTGGSREEHWEPQVTRNLAPPPVSFKCYLIPAIRMIGAGGSSSEGFSGEGIIERLAKLQNPPALAQLEKGCFKKIGDFLRTVTDNASAEIEIPFDRNTILVHMDGKTLPLESLGSGIHEVIILAAAATVLEDCVICMEEPEIHLNPILQKKLVRYLQEATSNQYFISSHSAALMDTPDAEVYHITMSGGASRVERVTSDRHRSMVCEDLGYHPSDLLQTNCVIWVEGPSDRIYLNWWIRAVAPSLLEGIHYSIMFYGGRLAAHVSGEDIQPIVTDFISLRRLNRRGVIVIDSDKSKKAMKINATKTRLRDEFDSGPGHAWVTEGREIENYLDASLLTKTINTVHPSAIVATSLEKYDNTLTIKNRSGENIQASKVKVANAIVESGAPNMSCHDLAKQVSKLVAFIAQSNPGVVLSKS